MSPSATLRLRRITAMIALAWAMLALVQSLWGGFALSEAPEWPMDVSGIGGVAIVQSTSPAANDAGVEVGDRLIAFDHRPVMRFARASKTLLEAGVSNIYTLEKRDGHRVDVELLPEPPGSGRSVPFHLKLGLLVVGAIYLGIGLAVWRLKPDRSEAWALLLFCSVVATELFTILHAESTTWAYPRLAINVPLLGATAFHLFTCYPIEPTWIVQHRRLQYLPYAAALVVSSLFFLEYPLGLEQGIVPAICFGFAALASTLGIGVLAVERTRVRDAVTAARADVMLLGAAVSFLPVVGILIAQYYLRTSLPYYYAMLWLFVFPAAVGYGIVRKQLFEIRMVAKSSAAYTFASLAITGLFALFIVFSDAAVSRFNVNARSTWFQVSFLFFAILAFNPIRDRMQQLVDRVFDRDRATYRRAVREISEAMVSMLSLREISDRILVALTDTMGVERAMVLLLDEEERVLRPNAWRGDWEDATVAVEIPATHPIWKHVWMRREELARHDFDDDPDPETREACRDVFDNLEIELLVPILFGVDLLGVIAVGPKHSGETLGADDRQLLRTLANQSSIAIENAKAYDEIGKLNENLEARVEERTGELRETQAQLVQAEKMKSLGQLVAGVAHELNNPIGFVHANLQLVDEYIKRLIAAEPGSEEAEQAYDAISKLLRRSREGTERVTKIVQDLRTFSRMDQAELQDVNLNEEIDRTLTLMEVRFKDGIEVKRDYGEIPRVRCFPGQLNQVFLNVLMNACDALGKVGTVDITTRPVENGVEITFRDNGPGIPADVQSRIFDPFFTTKPVGKGTGLGLSLSHEIVDRHGGKLRVESSPETGTTFQIQLPLEAKADADA